MSDAFLVTNALVAKLQADAALQALMPDGAWPLVAPPGLKRFVIVSLIEATNVRQFGGLAHKDALYLVEARALSTTEGDVQAAAARIDVLLDPTPPLPPATLTVPGYALIAMGQRCEADVEAVEVDDLDPSIRWNRCGGHYRVMVAPVAT